MRIGVLIVGSLLWDERPHRSKWRETRLVSSQVMQVAVPIRYGRRSSNRRDTYTMAFSRLVCRADYGMGTGVIVRCKRPATSIDSLTEEAQELWIAESTEGNPRNPLCASWGGVGTLFRPGIDDALREQWTTRACDAGYPELDHLKSEGPALRSDGTLNLRWPHTSNGFVLSGIDVLIATPTKPTLDQRRYPRAREIAAAWVREDAGEERYFFKNVEAGIRTFQDELIWRFLSRSDNMRYYRRTYRHAVEMLEERNTPDA